MSESPKSLNEGEIQVACDCCDGTGFDLDIPCEICNGEGIIITVQWDEEKDPDYKGNNIP